jgi:glucose-1-phosphate cytidylyltransferase
MKVVILCGGKGTRSYPFTEYLPKVMMPIKGSPIIVHLMRIFARQGFNEFVLAAGHRKEMLEDYFEGRVSDWKVNIVDTGEEADTGERILRCADYVGDRFMATYGDGLGDINLHRLIESHEKFGGLATLTTVPLRSQYGLVQFEPDGKVTRFVEKPVVPDFWINAGFFVFDKAAFSDWQGTNLESNVLTHFASQGNLYVYRHTGFWKSMDTSKDQQELERLCANGTAPWVASEATIAGRPA